MNVVPMANYVKPKLMSLILDYYATKSTFDNPDVTEFYICKRKYNSP